MPFLPPMARLPAMAGSQRARKRVSQVLRQRSALRCGSRADLRQLGANAALHLSGEPRCSGDAGTSAGFPNITANPFGRMPISEFEVS
jgi:hypothetical protein